MGFRRAAAVLAVILSLIGIQACAYPGNSAGAQGAASATKDPPCYGVPHSVVTAELCWVVRRGTGPLVVLFGDSHAGHWSPAAKNAALAHGLRLAVLTKASCPVADIRITNGGSRYWQCEAWRRGALRLLATVRPDVVIASSSASYGGVMIKNGLPNPISQMGTEWARGLRVSLDSLSRSATGVLLLRDMPLFPDYPGCAERPNPSRACRVPRDEALRPWNRTIYEADVRTARLYRNVTTADLSSVACAGNVCSPLGRSGARRYRDSNHMLPSFSGNVWPAFAAALHRVLRTAPSPPRHVRVARRGRGAAVSWSDPLSSGGTPVRSYVVVLDRAPSRARQSPQARCTVTTNSCRFTRLPSGIRYVVKVQARNAVGVSRPSRASFRSTPIRSRTIRAVAIRVRGGRVRMIATVPAGGQRSLRLQRRGSSGDWRTVARRKTNGAGRAVVTVRAPEGRATWRWIAVTRGDLPARSRLLVTRR